MTIASLRNSILSIAIAGLCLGCSGSSSSGPEGVSGDSSGTTSSTGSSGGTTSSGSSGGGTTSGGTTSGGSSGSSGTCSQDSDCSTGQVCQSGACVAAPTPTGSTGYDQQVLSDSPVGYWDLNSTSTGQEPDLTGHGHAGTYKGGTPALVALPNGDHAADFDGSSQYLTIPSSPTFSIPTTGELTWEAWIRPDVLQFPNASSGGYVDWMGKCESYSPTCEWEARMYSESNPQGRTSRLSAYVFNSTAGLGSGADFQPDSGVIQAGQWYHIVAEYQTHTQPAGCSGPEVGGINIWVNGVEWDQSAHGQTGCMSQYGVTPTANGSAVNIGSMAFDTWFKGAIGKVAIYDHLLTPTQIAAHFTAMTGRTPTGSCGSTCNLGG